MSVTEDPFFSIVVCTRNRTDILPYTLLALKNQSFKGFEVIISDNSDLEQREENKIFIEKNNFSQLHVVYPEKTLSMHENYNFAISHCKGNYVGVLTDKNFLRRNALKELYEFLKNNKVDIINYGHSGANWVKGKIIKWNCVKASQREDFEFYNPKNEFLRRISFKLNRTMEGDYYNFGKIFFGFYSRELIQKILNHYKAVFYPISPDYTSTALALSLAETSVFYYKKLMIAVNNYAGNGQKGATEPNATLKFLKTCTSDLSKLLETLPIPNVYTIHNLCAHDYEILNRFGNSNYPININNLALRVREDLDSFPYSSNEERESMFTNFNNFINENKILVPEISLPVEMKEIVVRNDKNLSFFKKIRSRIWNVYYLTKTYIKLTETMYKVHYISFFSMIS